MEEAPYIVSPSWIACVFSHIRSMIWNDDLVARGYHLYRESMFKMPYFGQWVTVVGPKYMEEVARAPGSALSFRQNFNEQLQLELLVGPALSHDQIHLALIRTLTRNLDVIYTEIADETEHVVNAELSKGKEYDGWITMKGYQLVDDVISRLNYRAFVGLPQCRDPRWKKAMDKDATDMGVRTMILKLFPASQRASVNSILSFFRKPLGSTIGIVTTLVQERLAMPEEERSNNLLSWILTRVPGEAPDPYVICGVLQLIMNVAQVTTSMSLGHALFHLVAHPEYIEILRDDITAAAENGTLTRESLDRMHKLDSFLRETQRLSGLGNLTLGRTAVQDFYFSNGVRLKAGEMVQAMAMPLHHDPSVYPDPLEFKPWRFYEPSLLEAGDSAGRGYDMVTPSSTFLAWGLGRHACPGRWYATMVLKHLMAYFLLNYDLKLPDSAKGVRPADLNVLSVHFPNNSAHVLFRRRIADEKD